jgi:D-alanyl-D-alanine carboxypeptidase
MKKTLIAVVLLLAALPSPAQSPAMRARIDSLLTALSGPPEQFEKYVQEAYTPELLGRTNAERRAEFIRRVQGDFGSLEMTALRRDAPNAVSISVEGSKGAKGTIRLEHETAPPHKITNLAFVIGEPEEDGPSLPPVPVNGRMSGDELSRALDAYIAQLAKEERFSGNVLVARDGKPVFEKSYGLANRSDNIPNSAQTRFSLGSINKHFTKIAVGQLIAAGKLSTSDTIVKHLPDYPNANAHNVTVQQLLDMNAGLADFFGPDFDAAAKHRFRRNRDYYAFVAPKALNFPPGTRKQYCNACFIVLGEIIERLSGMPYEQYIAENVFRRAGMQTAAFLASDEVAPNVSIGYMRVDGKLRSNLLTRGAAGSAAGSAFATTRDLLVFDDALRSGKLLDPQRTAWFYGLDKPAAERVRASEGYAGGSPGINAGVHSDGTWTVIALANIDPPAAEALTRAIYSQLIK